MKPPPKPKLRKRQVTIGNEKHYITYAFFDEIQRYYNYQYIQNTKTAVIVFDETKLLNT